MSRTSHYLVPFALVAIGTALLFSAGCRKKEEAKPTVDPASPESYMKDTAFRRELADRRSEMQKVAVESRQVADRMQALVDKHGEDEAKLKAIPEWNELHARLTGLNARYKTLKAEQQNTVRERLTPKKEISK